MIQRLRIPIIADLELQVPPKLYGGIKRVIDMLIDSLVERGYRPILFVHPDSTPNCPLVAYEVFGRDLWAESLDSWASRPNVFFRLLTISQWLDARQ